jgi:hypothetical protein
MRHMAMTTMVDPSRGERRAPPSALYYALRDNRQVSIRRTPQSLSQESLARRRTGDACGPTLGLENGAGLAIGLVQLLEEHARWSTRDLSVKYYVSS